MTPTTAKRPEIVSAASSGEPPRSRVWDSFLEELERDPAFRLERDNDLRYQVSRALHELRRFRDLTQQEVAAAAGTTQPKVAAAESGATNLTLATVERLVTALGGRIRLSIEPADA